ncbi:MAG: hypothetical protein U5K51_11230 [Flavobacteriaceae bacterium]|nr:hypothetical protein [Flavobacteriaceae bacterium]
MPYFELSNSENNFPPAYFADCDGLLAVGGELSAETLRAMKAVFLFGTIL